MPTSVEEKLLLEKELRKTKISLRTFKLQVVPKVKKYSFKIFVEVSKEI